MKYFFEYNEFKNEILLEGYVHEIRNNLLTIKSPNDAEKYLQQSIDKLKGKKYQIKQQVLRYVLSLLFSTVPINHNFINDMANKQEDPEIKNILLTYDDIGVADFKKYKGDLNDFLKKLAEKESSNDWKNRTKSASHVGKYSFGNIALKEIGKNFTTSDFVNNPSIWPEKEQDKDVVELLKKNKYYLRTHLNYIGQKIDNIKITLSGLLAAAHLLGAKTVKNYLDNPNDTIPADGNGTTILNYMDEFSQYDMKKIK